jgi:hypothetical protein
MKLEVKGQPFVVYFPGPGLLLTNLFFFASLIIVIIVDYALAMG